jgi:valyl-tRNA synthetase
MTDIPARYDPKEIEEKIYSGWEENGLFNARTGKGKSTYSIVIPPPNVTGILHMGHALNNTIQDILIRWKRLQGYEVLWMPGTDHAGIATQNVVERDIAKEGLKRVDLGREKFLDRVWKWKEDYGNTIIKQLKRMGCSCDWDRTRFTMDEGLSKAVREVFLRLYEDGLLYKGDYIINWCPRCETALSDEEAEHGEVEGNLYYIKYPIKGRTKLDIENEDYVVVATTRPETMLGDVAVAVNPGDERYKGLEGKTIVLPILKRELKIIFDETVDPEFGTGALKVTPAHDPVDFELGTKHGLERINVMNPDGTINSLGGDYSGMDRFECRETIVEDLKQRKLFIKAESHPHAVGHCYRCHTLVEPRLSKQWFVKMKPLAREAITVVRDGRVNFYPERWTKVYLNWMENIRDWCISRQIWWGHRIPVWYCKDCTGAKNVRDIEITAPGKKGIIVKSDGSVPEKCPDCGGSDLEQDPDVLDTWFSSWLWPFSTFGWPEKTVELKEFYPTDALVTAQEIIFFWVARMIMAGLKFMDEVPFRDIYIHGTVRDATGTKMSKSLGNVIDPIEIINEVGSDALRFSIISITSQGQDVFLSKEKFEFGRNFANKLWNAARYVHMNIDGQDLPAQVPWEDLSMPDKWIITEFNKTVEKVHNSLIAFRFNEAASELYAFIWHKYCDWYLELSKMSPDKKITANVLLKVLDGILRLLHPFMPFITEELWGKLPGNAGKTIMDSEWPVFDDNSICEESVSSVEKLIGMITSIRNIRSFWNVEVKTIVDVDFQSGNKKDIELIEIEKRYIERLGRCVVKEITQELERPANSIVKLVKDISIFVHVGKAIDISDEEKRINGKIVEMENYIFSLEKKLGNKNFVERAPKEVVEKDKAKKEKFEKEVAVLKENLTALK